MRTWATVLSFNAGKGLFFSLSRSVWMLSATEVQPSSLFLPLSLCPSYVLAWQCNCSVLHRFCGRYLWDPSVWERTSAWLPIYLSLISIMHTPAIPPTVSQSLSLCCHMQQNIALSFSSALLHFVFQTKGHFSVCHPDDDWQGIEAFVALIPLKSFLKMNPGCVENRPQLHLTPYCFVMEIKVFTSLWKRCHLRGR